MRLQVLLCFVCFVVQLADGRYSHNYPHQPAINPIWGPGPIHLRGRATFDLVYRAKGLYSTVISVGRPQQKLDLLLSTNPGHPTVRSTACKECGKHAYNATASITAKNLTRSQHVTQSTVGGDYSGRMVRDKITLGSMYMFMNFLSADGGSNEMKRGKYDGVLSLHYERGDNGFFDELTKMKTLKRTRIGIVLTQDRELKVDKKAGTMVIGDTDHNSFSDPMAFSYINSKYWAVSFHSFKMGTSEFCHHGPCLGVVTLDKEYVLVPDVYYNMIMKVVNGTKLANGLIRINCGDAHVLPAIEFTVGGESFKLPATRYKHEMDTRECVTIFQKDQKTHSLEFGLGTFFLSSFYIELGLYRMGEAITRGTGIARKRYDL